MAQSQSQLPLFFLTCGLTMCVAYVVMDSSEQTEAATTAGHSLDEIENAYHAAAADGQFKTHLEPFLHTDARALVDDSVMLRDRPVPPEQAAPRTSSGEPRELSADELDQIGTFYDMPVRPTHVLEFTMIRQDGPTKQTAVSPLYLVNEYGWSVVVGTLRDSALASRSTDKEHFSFTRRPGLWQHHWELRFPGDSPGRFALQFVPVASSGETVTVIDGDELPLSGDDNRILFHLIPQGSDVIHEQQSGGGLAVPYAVQVGNRAMSSQVELPWSDISRYEPIEEPAFDGDALTLATLTAKTADGDRAYRLALIRVAGR